MNDSGPEHVLVVYAHPNPESFTHAVLDQIVRGLADAGYSYEVLDLYAIGFDPVFSLHDSTQFIHHTLPDGTLDRALLGRILIDGAGKPDQTVHGQAMGEGQEPRRHGQAVRVEPAR